MGEKGAEWLHGLPDKFKELICGFHAGSALNHCGAVSWIAPARLFNIDMAMP